MEIHIFKKWAFMILFSLAIVSCDEDSKCSDCGDLLGGFLIMEVTTNDLAKYEGLAQLEGVDVGVCIRAYILDQELNVKSVTIVDDCCCKF